MEQPRQDELEAEVLEIKLEIKGLKASLVKWEAKAEAAEKEGKEEKADQHWADHRLVNTQLVSLYQRLERKEGELLEDRRRSNPVHVRSVRHGQPRIAAHGSISSSSESLPDNHADACVEVSEGFALFEEIGSPRVRVAHVLWGVVENQRQDALQWSSESDVCSYVSMFLKEVACELNLPLEFRAEVGFFKLRPDITVVKAFGIPVGVIEVKKPKSGILDNAKVLGELYDYMKQIVNFYGLKEVFGILTTYQEWRVCWMKTAAQLAQQSPFEAIDAEPRTPLNSSGEGEGKSPPGLTPSKRLETVHELGQGAGDIDGEVELEEDNSMRVMMSTRVWNLDENVFNLIGSVLWKMNVATDDADLIGSGQMVIQLTENSFFWCKRPEKAGLKHLRWSEVPRATKLLLLEDLGVGHSGRVWLVCSGNGLVGVLKFSVANPPTHWSGTLEDFRNDYLKRELKWWKEIYPELGEMCSVQKFAGHWALLMPHLCAPKRNDATLTLVEQTLRTNFVDRGLMHGDVLWRNIGVYKRNNETVCVVYDLESVGKSQSSDWVEVAINKLRKDCSDVV